MTTSQADPFGPLRLDGRSVVVVGAGSGIGRATSQIAASLGARVTVVDTDEEAGTEVAEATGGEFRPVDATEPQALADLFAEVVRSDGLDAVVTTVGGAHLAELDELEPSIWQRELGFNLTSAYGVIRGAVPHLRARGGSIVTTSTGYAALPAPDRAGYAAAKAGVISLTRSVAAAEARHGVRINCVAPGPTDTPRFRAMNGGDEGVERVRQALPLGFVPSPADVAWMNVFLCTDAARAMTGQVVHVNAGIHMP